ncbi:hypothetical protein [Pedobacter steynii]|jgi:hypothetical protein
MRTFPVRFRKASMELDVLVTSSDNCRKFKVEMVTGEPDPIVLSRTNGEWTVEHPGTRCFPPEGYEDLEKAIDNYLAENP